MAEETETLRRTPLYGLHLERGARMGTIADRLSEAGAIESAT